MKTLTFGIKEIDGVFGGLRIGEFIVFHGTHMCHIFSELLCIRGQLKNEKGGLNSSIIFISTRWDSVSSTY